MNILFIHAIYGNQFLATHNYFNDSGLATSYLLTHEGERQAHQFDERFAKNIFTYTPDGYNNEHSYYYSGSAEYSARNAIRILEAVRNIMQHHKIDVIVAHHRAGSPDFLLGNVSVPVIAYFEFPSHRQHGYVPEYPPQEAQLLAECYFEAVSYRILLHCDLAITPSAHARAMFPEVLRHKIIPQMDGFDSKQIELYCPEDVPFQKEEGCIYIGFTSRTLSSEKGYEQFVQISKRLAEVNDSVRFVVIGQKDGVSYGYENIFLDNTFGKGNKTFSDYLFEKYDVPEDKYIFLDQHLPYKAFSSCVHHVDFFILPILHGSATWNVFECLLRGKIVLGSDRCFMPELISHEQDGFLLPCDNISRWVETADDIARNFDKYKFVGENAKKRAEQYHTENVAKRYLQIFSETCSNFTEK